MEDAATAEISRSQVWQWIFNAHAPLDDGTVVTEELVRRLVDEELARLPGGPEDYREATDTFLSVAIPTGSVEDFAEFLTLPAYERMA